MNIIYNLKRMEYKSNHLAPCIFRLQYQRTLEYGQSQSLFARENVSVPIKNGRLIATESIIKDIERPHLQTIRHKLCPRQKGTMAMLLITSSNT